MRKNFALVAALIFSLVLIPPPAIAEPGGYSYEDFQRFKEAINGEALNGQGEINDATDPADSVPTDLLNYVRNDRKAQFTLGSMAVAETLIAAMLWKRMRANRAGWERQVATSGEVAQRLAPRSRNYALAEYDLSRSLKALDAADRAEALKATEKLSSRPKLLLERAFSTEKPKFPAATMPGSSRLERGARRLGQWCRRIADAVVPGRTPAAARMPAPPSLSETGREAPEARPLLSIEQASANLQKAYAEWQVAAEAETRVLRAVGRAELAIPGSLTEINEQTSAAVRAVTLLGFTAGQFYAFREEGTKAIARSARVNLGTNLGWRGRLWRKTRTGLLLLALPLVVLGISHADDLADEARRREEDANRSSLQDREKWLNTFIPYFNRPLLYTVVRAWTKVSQRPRSHLKIPCPYEVKEAELDNPDLSVMQSLSLQTILEMDGQGIDVVVAGNRRTVKISPSFYKRLFRKILESENSPLLKLEPRALEEVLDELANEAFHGFDQIDFAPPGPKEETGDEPSFGFDRNK